MDGNAQGAAVATERFDFGDSSHVTTEQLRMLRSLDELLARNLTHALSAWLRTGVTVMPEGQTPSTFREFLDRAEDAYLLPVHLPEVHATGLLRWPLQLANHMIELLLGGSGSGAAGGRELTEIEDEIFQAVLDVLMREWNGVWQQIALRLAPGERSRDGGERQLMPPGEKVFCFNFRVGAGESSGEVSLCVAAPALASVMRRAPSLQRSQRNHAEADVRALLQAMDEARVRVGLCFPPVRLQANRLAALRVGGTLVLPLPSNAVAEFRVNEVPVAPAAPVRVGAWRAVNVLGAAEAGAQRRLAAQSASTRTEGTGAHG